MPFRHFETDITPAAESNNDQLNTKGFSGGQDDTPVMRSPQPASLYWRAVIDVDVYNMPMGHRISTAPMGTVVAETGRHIDMFDQKWIALMMTNASYEVAAGKQDEARGLDNDFMVWTQPFVWQQADSEGADIQRLSAAPTPVKQWERVVVEDSNTPITSVGANADFCEGAERLIATAMRSCRPDMSDVWDDDGEVAFEDTLPRYRPPACLSGVDVCAIGCFWLCLNNGDAAFPVQGNRRFRDWNSEYQRLLESLLFSNKPGLLQKLQNPAHKDCSDISSRSMNAEKESDKAVVMTSFLSEFVDECAAVIGTIVREMVVPSGKRTVKTLEQLVHAASANGSTAAYSFYATHFNGEANVLGKSALYFHNGIYYRLFVDTTGTFGNDDQKAMKFAGQCLRSVQYLNTVGAASLLNTPLTALLTFQGFRLLVMTIPPVNPADVVLRGGIAFDIQTHNQNKNAMTSDTDNDNIFLSRIMSTIGKRLNLPRLQKAVPDDPRSFYPILPDDFGVYAGKDGRLYAFDVGRLLPPALLPVSKGAQHFSAASSATSTSTITPPRSSRAASILKHVASSVTSTASMQQQQCADSDCLFARIRPEIASNLLKPVEGDAFTVPCRPLLDGVDDVARLQQRDVEAARVTQWIQHHGVPELAAVLGFLVETKAPTIVFTCIGCDRTETEHIAFRACKKQPDGADGTSVSVPECFLCPQCYVDLSKIGHWQGDMENAIRQLQEWVAAASPNATAVQSFSALEMTPDVTTLCHAHGINLRFMGYLHSAIPRSAKPCTAHFLEIEMIARSAKRLLMKELHFMPSDEQRRECAARFYSMLLGSCAAGEGDTDEQSPAEIFWSTQLGPEIQRYYDVLQPFETDRLDKSVIARRVGELTGIELSASSIESYCFNSCGEVGNRPFVQLCTPHPVMKNLRMTGLKETTRENNLDGDLFFFPPSQTLADANEALSVLASFRKSAGNFWRPRLTKSCKSVLPVYHCLFEDDAM